VDSIVTALINTVPTLIALMVQLLMAFGLLYMYDMLLALLTFLVTPITILFGMVIGQKIKVVQKKIQEADALKHSIINEALQNIIILKSFNYVIRNLERVKALQADHFELVKRKNRISINSNLMLGFGYQLGFFGAVTFGAFRLASKAITVGTFTAFIQLVGQIQAPIQGLASSLPQLIASLSSVERIHELDEIENDRLLDDNTMIHSAVPSKIVVKNISFAYKENHPVFSGLNMTINRGEKVAIVGPSGEGKTTLVHMLLSLIEPDAGEITIETGAGGTFPLGVGTRRFFSYVPQTNTLFSGSIYDNFLLNHDVSDEAIENALIASCCKSFIDELPEGLDTLMGERGIGLSQGQAQRISIARALLHETPFLVFDEATSALDIETERNLISNLKQYYPLCTLIAVTHRESIFDICDRVYWMKNGGLTYEA
jgi:ABC-type multidrug transport system fused ATPase/permease subunit